MTNIDMLSINNVAAKLGLSVHQLRRWELMFGLEIKRGRGQQRQYREEDMSVLERIKELVEQGWPTSQIRPQLEAEGLLTPKLIGVPTAPGNPEVLQEAIIGLRNFTERRFIELSKQIDELRQLLISVTLKQELSTDKSSPWQPVPTEYIPTPKTPPPQEITIGPQISIDPPSKRDNLPQPPFGPRPIIGAPAQTTTSSAGAASGQSQLDAVFGARPSEGPKNPIIPPPQTTAATSTGADSSQSGMQSSPGQPIVRHSTIPPTPQDLQSSTSAPTSAAELTAGGAPVGPDEAPEARTEARPDFKQETPRDPFALPPLPPNPFRTNIPSQPTGAAAPLPPAAPNPYQGLTGAEPARPTYSMGQFGQTAAQPEVSIENFSPSAASEDTFTAKSGEDLLSSSEQAFSEGEFETLEADTVESERIELAEPEADLEELEEAQIEEAQVEETAVEPAPQVHQAILPTPGPQVNFGPNVSAPTPQATPQPGNDNFGLGEVTDQNYLTVLGRALDLIGWTDEQADSYSLKAFGIPHWDELGRSQAEKLVGHLINLLREQLS